MSKTNTMNIEKADDTGQAGIFINDALLADPNLTPAEKLLYLIIKREVEASPIGIKGFSLITNEALAKMLGVARRTITNLVASLVKRKLIFIAMDTLLIKKKGKEFIRTFRYIYLDSKKAGYHQREMKRRKNTKAYTTAEYNREWNSTMKYAYLFEEEGKGKPRPKPISPITPPPEEPVEDEDELTLRRYGNVEHENIEKAGKISSNSGNPEAFKDLDDDLWN